MSGGEQERSVIPEHLWALLYKDTKRQLLHDNPLGITSFTELPCSFSEDWENGSLDSICFRSAQPVFGSISLAAL